MKRGISQIKGGALVWLTKNGHVCRVLVLAMMMMDPYGCVSKKNFDPPIVITGSASHGGAEWEKETFLAINFFSIFFLFLCIFLPLECFKLSE